MRGTVTGIGVLDKAMAIVDAVEFQPMTASEVAQKLGVNLSTTHRLAMALVEHGLLARDGENRFHAGPRFDTNRLALAARPILAELRDQTAESAQLWIRRGDVRVCQESADATQELRVTLPVGWVLPLAEGGSAGRILSGESTQQEDDGTDPGWIESISQRTVGLASVSAPVRVGEEIVAAICLVAPLPRVTSTPGEQWGKFVAAAADELAALLSR
ncbi:IclR family transcriptional regulator [Agromyces sp. NPDC058484]|uniref:IclR family transcriptional regulator n=1 Tax=Agromyces sp. NPDC058484 TaxID=3346524 RepID=UPI00365D8473